MPSKDQCAQCKAEVTRSPSSAAVIVCRTCRALNRCGTTAGYSAGCRCQRCKDAKAASMREYIARRKAEGRPVPRSKWRAYEDLVCDCCGVTFNREKRNDPRYAKAYCTLLCRDYTKYGPRARQLPKDHISKWVGQTCELKQPAEPTEYECGWCGVTGMTMYPTTGYCSRRCRKRAHAMRRRGRVFNAHGTYTWGQVVKLWAAFGKACAYCQQTLALEDMQAEHVVALARGGANNIGNILPACGACNSDKRDLSMQQWAADRQRRKLPPVTTTWDERDTRYSHLVPRVHELAA